jgi:ribosomal-protein-alanine N-acetyltransferase
MINCSKLESKDIKQVILLEEQFLGESLGEEMILNELNNPNVCFLSAKDDEKVIGYIGAYTFDDSMEILNFVVDEAYQRQGVGSLLFNTLLNMYDKTKSIVLEVRYNNEKGISFYKKNNFNVISIRKHYYKNGDDAIVMMKEII